MLDEIFFWALDAFFAESAARGKPSQRNDQ
jgi:hypothetical protein